MLFILVVFLSFFGMEEWINFEYKKMVSGIYAVVLMRIAVVCVLISFVLVIILYKGIMEVKGGMIIIEIKRLKMILFSFVFFFVSGYVVSEFMKINKVVEMVVMMIVFRKDCLREVCFYVLWKF